MADEQRQEFRSRIATDLEERYERIFTKLLDESEKATKKVRLQCPHCHKVNYVEVDNIEEMRKTAVFMTEHGFGRAPSSGEGSQDEGVKVVYQVILGDADDSPLVST